MNKSIVIYWVQFFKILYCIGIVLYWPNTFKNCIVYCIVKENAKSPGLAYTENLKGLLLLFFELFNFEFFLNFEILKFRYKT